MEQLINALMSGAPSATVLLAIIVLFVILFWFYVIPLSKERDKLTERLESMQKELDSANSLLREHVASGEIHQRMAEVLDVCRETYSVVAQQIKIADNEYQSIRTAIDRAVTHLDEQNRLSDRASSDAISRVNTELQFALQQIMSVNQRMMGITNMMLGSSDRGPNSMFGTDERGLK